MIEEERKQIKEMVVNMLVEVVKYNKCLEN